MVYWDNASFIQNKILNYKFGLINLMPVKNPNNEVCK
jgi:hypothetical protein